MELLKLDIFIFYALVLSILSIFIWSFTNSLETITASWFLWILSILYLSTRIIFLHLTDIKNDMIKELSKIEEAKKSLKWIDKI